MNSDFLNRAATALQFLTSVQPQQQSAPDAHYTEKTPKLINGLKNGETTLLYLEA